MISKFEIDQCLKGAKDGIIFINEIIQKYQVSSLDYIILFPHICRELNQIGMKYLEVFAEAVSARKVIVIFRSEDTEFIQIQNDKNIFRYIQLTSKSMTCILNGYAMMDFPKHMIVVSLDMPNGRYGSKVIENEQMNLEEVVALGIFGLDKCIR